MIDSTMQVYIHTFQGLYALLLMVFVQAIVATVAHRLQKQYVPGIVDEKLSHESFVFRSHRTFMNSLENVPFMFGLSILAILVGYNSYALTCFVWTYVVARLIHMALYYVIATEKNPSLRSIFFMVGFAVQLTLFVVVGLSWV